MCIKFGHCLRLYQDGRPTKHENVRATFIFTDIVNIEPRKQENKAIFCLQVKLEVVYSDLKFLVSLFICSFFPFCSYFVAYLFLGVFRFLSFFFSS